MILLKFSAIKCSFLQIVATALMGPVAYAAHMKGPLRVLTNYSDQLDVRLKTLRI